MWPVIDPISCQVVPAKLPLICPRAPSTRSNSPCQRVPPHSELQLHRPATEPADDMSEASRSADRLVDLCGSAACSPPETDLSCLPISPPVDPACARATCRWPHAKSPTAMVEINRRAIPYLTAPPFPPGRQGESRRLLRPACPLRAVSANRCDDATRLTLLVTIRQGALLGLLHVGAGSDRPTTL